MRQRVDLWLFRARFCKTRASAARLIAEGGVRLVRDGAGRRLEKASAELAVGDALIFVHQGGLRTVRVERLPVRREPPAEAGALYSEIAATY